MFTVKSKKGFTLIELLVVISIIGALAAVILPALSGAREKVKETKTKATLNQMKTLVNAAQLNTGKTVMQITGNGCSACACPGSTNLATLPDTHICSVRWKSVIDKISIAAGGTDGAAFYNDVWGLPYMLDENEGENTTTPCRPDILRSAGPDLTAYNTDDILIILPYLNC